MVTERLGEKKTRKGQWHWDGGKRTIHEVLRKLFATIYCLMIAG